MSDLDLDPVVSITADAIGEPGQRTFYLQARGDDTTVTLLVEKGQVAALTGEIDELLARIGGATDTAEAPDLQQPLVPAFRVGAMGIGYDSDRDLVLLECREFVPPADEDDELAELEPIVPDSATVRMWATRDQMEALARRGERAVAGGRPTCTMCGAPIDPEGHFCPPSNGHREITRLS
jgi:uncharacterized repeat protein (TIGR03847 family)